MLIQILGGAGSLLRFLGTLLDWFGVYLPDWLSRTITWIFSFIVGLFVLAGLWIAWHDRGKTKDAEQKEKKAE